MSALIERFPLPVAPQRRVRLGLLGSGYIARDGYFPAIELLQQEGWPIEVAAVSDLRADRRAAAAARHPAAALFESSDALLEANLCDAVLILLWPPQAAEMAVRAVARNLAVLVEKPVAQQAIDITGMRERLGARESRVQVAYNRPQQPLAALWREKIGSRWRSPEAALEVRLWRVQRDEKLFYEEVGVHPLSFLLAHCGELHVERAAFGPTAGGLVLPSWLRAELRSASGQRITLDMRPAVGRGFETYDFLTCGRSCRIDYLAQTGLSDGAGLAWWEGGKVHQEFQLDPASSITDAAIMRGFVHQLAHFVRLAAGEDGKPVCSLADAERILLLWEAIQKAAGEGSHLE